MKKFLVALVILSVVLVCYFSLIGIKKEIIQDYPAIQFNTSDGSDVIETNIVIKGTLTTKLFRGSEFEGKIEYSNDALNISNITLMPPTTNGFLGFIEIQETVGVGTFPEPIAYFQTEKDFSRININTIDSPISVVGPATTVEEAKVIIGELRNIY